MPQLKPTRGLRLNKNHPLARGLIGCWLFNEGSGNKVFDLSGNGRSGILVGAYAWGAGKFGSGVDLDGSSAYGKVTNSSAFEFGSGDSWSVLAWVNADTFGTMRNIARLDEGGTDRDLWLFRYNDSNQLQITFGDSAGTLHTSTSTTTITTAGWHQVVCVVNGGQDKVYLYIDGIEEANDTDTSSSWSTTPDPLGIGAYIGTNGTGTPKEFFSGLIGHIMLYNRALSASEISQLYRKPFCTFEWGTTPELMFVSEVVVHLAGSISAQSAISASLVKLLKLAGLVDATTSLPAFAKTIKKVSGAITCTSDVTALLNSIRYLLEMEKNWLRGALFNGMTANAFKLGTTLSLGWFWVRVTGCSVLYRGSSMGEMDFPNVLSASEQDACEISPPSYLSHSNGSTYFYVIRRFNSCGCQERTLAAAVKVSIKSNGELAEPRPNNISNSKVKQVDSNKIQLVWFYCPIEQKSQPVSFNVYYDDRTGQIDYQNPLATIDYKERRFYSYQSDNLDSGRYLFAVRAEDTEGLENSSLAQLKIQLNTTSLDAINILSAEAV